MRVLVIGGTAFMGPHVVRYLEEAGHQVSVFHRGKTGQCAADATHIHSDRRELIRFRPQFEALAPEVCVHMVAMDQRDAEITLESLRGIVRRIVVISSMDVYRAYGRFIGKESGAIDNTPFTEDAPLRTIRYPYRADDTPADSVLYNYDKIIVETAFLECSDVETTVLRLPAVYGPSDKQHRTFDYVKRMVDGRRAILLDDEMAEWRWSRGYVEDVAWGIYLAATNSLSSRIYNISEPIAQREYDWLQSIARAMHWDGEIVRKPTGKTDAIWGQHVAADSSRIRSELGYDERITAAEALQRTVEWEAAQIKSGAIDRAVDYAAEDAILNVVNGSV